MPHDNPTDQASPLIRRITHRWHTEPINDLWRVGDDHGNHLRKHFFTQQAAQDYADRLL